MQGRVFESSAIKKRVYSLCCRHSMIGSAFARRNGDGYIPVCAFGPSEMKAQRSFLTFRGNQPCLSLPLTSALLSDRVHQTSLEKSVRVDCYAVRIWGVPISEVWFDCKRRASSRAQANRLECLVPVDWSRLLPDLSHQAYYASVML